MIQFKTNKKIYLANDIYKIFNAKNNFTLKNYSSEKIFWDRKEKLNKSQQIEI